jgi:hypothetical protein
VTKIPSFISWEVAYQSRTNLGGRENISRRLFPAHKFRESGKAARQVLYPTDTDTISADKPDGTAVCVYVWAGGLKQENLWLSIQRVQI